MNRVVYIKVPAHIRQWAYHSYGNPIIFPIIGNEVASYVGSQVNRLR